MRFKRFFCRGLKNVTIEFYLLAFIQKFHQKNQNDRLDHHLHELKTNE